MQAAIILSSVLGAVKRVDGVFDARRVTPS